MEPDKLPHNTMAGAMGELVLQNGRQAGVRRPLGTPTTFVGRNQGCDIRLNVDGVDPLHCLFVSTEAGVILRDLNSINGTYVNGVRSDNVTLQHGDVVKVGPFQFRLELAPVVAKPQPAEDTSDEMRESLRIQAAAVAAQQIALEEEETRLEKRKAALRQQEEQLAAHLAEKQRQVQLWSEYTKSERENLRKEKIEHEKKIAKMEGELVHAQQELDEDHKKLDLERQHINKVYQRLRQRWQKQWSTEKEKYARIAEKIQAEAAALIESQRDLRERETALAQDTIALNTERELSMRQLQDGRDTLKKDQESWRKRRSLEFAALNSRRQEIEETQAKILQVRHALQQDKEAWTHRLHTLQVELHGVNNRINHQRLRIQENEEKLARLDALRRESQRSASTELPLNAAVTEQTQTAEVPSEDGAVRDDYQQRCAELDRLAGELADQRSLLVEQYTRLAEIQESWQNERSQAAAELETLALRLAADEQALSERQQQTSAAEELLLERQAEVDQVRQEILVWRAQLKERERTFDEEHEREMAELQAKDTLLQEQLTALAQLRQRWNQRRQEEIEHLQTDRALLARDQQETQAQRVELFGKGQQIAEEKRLLAEKALALEQYRQEVFLRAKDPAAQRRVERLRRRWMSLNAGIIGNAKAERDQARKELARLDESRVQLLDQIARLTQEETALAETRSQLDEREAHLNSRQMYIALEVRQFENPPQPLEDEPLTLNVDVESIAQEAYEDDTDRSIHKAA